MKLLFLLFVTIFVSCTADVSYDVNFTDDKDVIGKAIGSCCKVTKYYDFKNCLKDKLEESLKEVCEIPSIKRISMSNHCVVCEFGCLAKEEKPKE